jgi:hypothetical protein
VELGRSLPVFNFAVNGPTGKNGRLISKINNTKIWLSSPHMGGSEQI